VEHFQTIFNHHLPERYDLASQSIHRVNSRFQHCVLCERSELYCRIKSTFSPESEC